MALNYVIPVFLYPFRGGGQTRKAYFVQAEGVEPSWTYETFSIGTLKPLPPDENQARLPIPPHLHLPLSLRYSQVDAFALRRYFRFSSSSEGCLPAQQGRG